MNRLKKYASSTDVARLAGVSQSAVSRTYKPGASVSEETRAKVLAAAQQLDYRPSMIPRIMLTHRSNLVAIVIGGMYNPFYSVVLEQFTIRLQAAGWQVLLLHVDSGHSFDAVIPRLASYRVDAIVSALAVLAPESAAELARFRIPTISFNTPVKNEWLSSVCCDNWGAARTAVDLFLARGARSFGYISGPAGSPANEERLGGFRERLRELGHPDPTVIGGHFRYEGGYASALQMCRGADRPDAIFCANDLVAIGAIDALRKELRLDVPGDVMVAGFDDIPAAGYAGYDLTTFVHDGKRMVDESLKILAAATASPPEPHEARIVVPAILIERGTTGPRA
jgi:DNA-binding LacI/PurR family transcriptional regulator